jgi:hypothetical protein
MPACATDMRGKVVLNVFSSIRGVCSYETEGLTMQELACQCMFHARTL